MPDKDLSYLLVRQADPARLRRIAFEEFSSARNSGRLVAFVGSYASAHLGYPKWSDMVKTFIDNARIHAKWPKERTAILNALIQGETAKLPDVDRMDLAELLAMIDKHVTPDFYAEARKAFMTEFRLNKATRPVDSIPNATNVSVALHESLGLTRFMTLNYDLEIEWALFLNGRERPLITGDQRERHFWSQAFGLSSADVPPPLLERYMLGGGLVSSDVVTRGVSAQLIEFALDTPVIHKRVLHLHGRVDQPDSLLVTRRDYRDRYWQGGFSKQPFEYGMRLIFAGNPILFVGIGGNEGEVMRVLEQVLSDNPNRRAVPMFMLWNSSGDADADNARRLLFNRKFGIHLLFDNEIAESLGIAGGYEEAKGKFSAKPDLLGGFRLTRSITMLAAVAESSRAIQPWELQDCRSPQVKYQLPPRDQGDTADAAKRPDAKGSAKSRRAIAQDATATGGDFDEEHICRVDIWAQSREDKREKRPAEGSSEAEERLDAALLAALGASRPIQVLVGDPGSGRGAIAHAIAGALTRHYSRPESKGRVVAVNGSFATETDSIFGILSGCVDGETAQHGKKSRAQAIAELFTALRSTLDPTESDLITDLPPETASQASQAFPAAGDQEDEAMPGPSLMPVTIIINGMERFLAHDGSALSAELDVLIRIIIKEFQRTASLTGQESASSAFPLNLVLIGTARVLRYLSVVAPDAFDQHRIERLAEPRARSDHARAMIAGTPIIVECKSYFDVVADAVNARLKADVVSVPRNNRERGARRRAFFASLFDRGFAAANDALGDDLAYKVLRVMAFIGQPIEPHVLHHVPGLVDLPEDPKLSDKSRFVMRQQRINNVIADLRAVHLVLPIQGFDGKARARIGLHKTVIAELRERYGVPMADSRLANGFNLSLYTAQPVEAYSPAHRWHVELGKLVDFLAGAHRDFFEPDEAIVAAFAAARAAAGVAPKGDRLLFNENKEDEDLARLASPQISDCLRSALSILRSYYSVPALLGHSNRELDPWLRDGPLSEHADRLARLLQRGNHDEKAASIRMRISTC